MPAGREERVFRAALGTPVAQGRPLRARARRPRKTPDSRYVARGNGPSPSAPRKGSRGGKKVPAHHERAGLPRWLSRSILERTLMKWSPSMLSLAAARASTFDTHGPLFAQKLRIVKLHHIDRKGLWKHPR